MVESRVATDQGDNIGQLTRVTVVTVVHQTIPQYLRLTADNSRHISH